MATEINIKVSEEAAKIMERPLHLKTLGNLAYGGQLWVDEQGETRHGDHGYAEYLVPEDAYNLPVIAWHGQGESGAYFQSTPDGREGLWQIMARLGWATYIIDQNRRGRASYTEVEMERIHYGNLDHEADVWKTFRNGLWFPPGKASCFEGSQFPLSPYAVNQFFRQQAKDPGDPVTDEYTRFLAEQFSHLLDETGPSIMFTHSMAGRWGWMTGALYSDKVKGIISYEPGSYMVPDDYEIPFIPSPQKDYDMNAIMAPGKMPKKDWLNLTKFPIRIYYGDFMPEPDEASEIYGNEVWRFSKIFAQIFVDLINENGGDAKLIFLPKLGITGNTHDAFSDLNNLEVMNVIHKDMIAAGLGAKDHPYQGPDRRPLEKYTIPMEE